MQITPSTWAKQMVYLQEKVDNTLVHSDSDWFFFFFNFFPNWILLCFHTSDIQTRRNDSFDLFHSAFYSVELNLSIDGTVLMKKQQRKISRQEVWGGNIIAAVVCWKGHSDAILCALIGFPLPLPFALSQCFPCHSKHEEAFSQAWNSLHVRITS